ncbi:hypothetical protein [Paraburkholderia bonniea]|uniref:hypothetical protein n=1 Tax=Paraburkholderia bonniea TaxID=2152891 RepID=UPI0012914A7A|nr:hypothetical protein [Paraburkholderia bonniea]
MSGIEKIIRAIAREIEDTLNNFDSLFSGEQIYPRATVNYRQPEIIKNIIQQNPSIYYPRSTPITPVQQRHVAPMPSSTPYDEHHSLNDRLHALIYHQTPQNDPHAIIPMSKLIHQKPNAQTFTEQLNSLSNGAACNPDLLSILKNFECPFLSDWSVATPANFRQANGAEESSNSEKIHQHLGHLDVVFLNYLADLNKNNLSLIPNFQAFSANQLTQTDLNLLRSSIDYYKFFIQQKKAYGKINQQQPKSPPFYQVQKNLQHAIEAFPKNGKGNLDVVRIAHAFSADSYRIYVSDVKARGQIYLPDSMAILRGISKLKPDTHRYPYPSSLA